MGDQPPSPLVVRVLLSLLYFLTLSYYDDLSFSLASSLVLPMSLSVLGFPRYGYFCVRFLLRLCLTPCRPCDSVVSLCFSVPSSRSHVLASLCFVF